MPKPPSSDPPWGPPRPSGAPEPGAASRARARPGSAGPTPATRTTPRASRRAGAAWPARAPGGSVTPAAGGNPPQRRVPRRVPGRRGRVARPGSPRLDRRGRGSGRGGGAVDRGRGKAAAAPRRPASRKGPAEEAVLDDPSLRQAVTAARLEKLQERLKDATEPSSASASTTPAACSARWRRARPPPCPCASCSASPTTGSGKWKLAIVELEAFSELTGTTEQHPVLGRLLPGARPPRPGAGAVGGPARARRPAPRSSPRGASSTPARWPTRAGWPTRSPCWRPPSRRASSPQEHHLRVAYALADLHERAGDLPKARQLFARRRGGRPGAGRRRRQAPRAALSGSCHTPCLGWAALPPPRRHRSVGGTHVHHPCPGRDQPRRARRHPAAARPSSARCPRARSSSASSSPSTRPTARPSRCRSPGTSRAPTPPDWEDGEELLVTGRTRRRFFRSGGAPRAAPRWWPPPPSPPGRRRRPAGRRRPSSRLRLAARLCPPGG